MSTLFSRKQMEEALRNPVVNNDVGIGLYRQGYRQYGLSYWGIEVASEVRYFLEHVAALNTMPLRSMLDIAAGTGKNALEFARLGVKNVVAVEIDSIGASHLLNAVITLEEAGLLPENQVTVIKDDAIRFLRNHTGQYDVVVSYGLLHVFKDQHSLQTAVSLIQKSVAPGGYLILQAITDKYPAPAIQPELDGVIVNAQTFSDNFPNSEWMVIHSDETDIVHSHSGSDEHHRHGSIRTTLQRVKL